MEPASPEESEEDMTSSSARALSALQQDRLERLAETSQKLKNIRGPSGPMDDTDWWQDPLNKAIGRKKPDNVTRHYPKTIEETMDLASKFM